MGGARAALGCGVGPPQPRPQSRRRTAGLAGRSGVLLSAPLVLARGALPPQAPSRAAAGVDLRVAKGHYARGYDAVRLSVIGEGSEGVATQGLWDWSGPFSRSWTSRTLHTRLLHVPPGGVAVPVSGEAHWLSLPAPGSGVTGLFVADPCFSGRGGFACPNEKRFRMLDRMTGVVNTLVGSADFHFWGLLGDNFYDTAGEVTGEFFAHLGTKAKLKPFMTVPGNHDFWISGSPPGVETTDQFGYGFLQFYGQDTVAAAGTPGTAPYTLGGPPTAIPAAENFIFGTQLGDLAFFGYSGAHNWGNTEPHAQAFCNFVGGAPSVNAAVLLGHWNVPNLGCRPGMDVPSVFARMKRMAGCDVKRLVYFMGHEHCNQVTAQRTGVLDAVGFMVGGAGMFGNGCSQFGFAVLQSDPAAEGGPNVRVDYFEVASDRSFGRDPASLREDYEEIIACFQSHPYAHCRAWHARSFRATSPADIVGNPGPLGPAGPLTSRTTARPFEAGTTAQPPLALTQAPATRAPNAPPSGDIAGHWLRGAASTMVLLCVVALWVLLGAPQWRLLLDEAHRGRRDHGDGRETPGPAPSASPSAWSRREERGVGLLEEEEEEGGSEGSAKGRGALPRGRRAGAEAEARALRDPSAERDPDAAPSSGEEDAVLAAGEEAARNFDAALSQQKQESSRVAEARWPRPWRRRPPGST